ncbi:MAG: hypothetical protein HQ508_07050 [Candidatus Marinimicrobia bacterium]|nr:hypothetical protein [Candidatus Neomarinimicrobiota bacterium]
MASNYDYSFVCSSFGELRKSSHAGTTRVPCTDGGWGSLEQDGVWNLKGKVQSYENMVVVNGFIMQANLDLDPDLSMTTLAEYISATFPEKSGLSPRG